MRITVETASADMLVLNMSGADKDRAEAIRRTDRRVLFMALKGEVEFRIRLEQDSGTAAERQTKEGRTNMRITIETEAADELVLNMSGADRDREEAIRRMDRRILFNVLKGETEALIRHELERRSAAERQTKMEALTNLLDLARTADERTCRAAMLGAKALARAIIHKARNRAAKKEK